MSDHPDLAEEQAYIDHAYECLDRSREEVWKLRGLTEVGRGGTFQARWEQEVFEENIRNRLTQLELHTAALVFGRIDRLTPGGDGPETNGPDTNGDHDPVDIESFHIGRLAVSDEYREPVVVDWRAPVAEPFYRATGRNPMGLARRRHFSVRGRELLAIEDELFGVGHLGIGTDIDSGSTNGQVAARPELRGYSTLIAALEQGRTGQLGDIVATIQAEQDEIIRSAQSGVLVVQGGPGTGKTVVALHRAAYLLYTYRFPLEDQGVLVIGPNRLFLRYIERVLPSLGEAGVEQVVMSDLVPDVRFGDTESGRAARVKGDPRMAAVIAKAVRDRARPLGGDLVVPFGTMFLRLRASDSQRIVASARRRFRRHNAARRWVEGEVFATLAASARAELGAEQVRERLRHTEGVRGALERMWPVLTPAQLLHDLFGSKALLKLAAVRHLDEDEYLALYRPRAAEVADVRWTDADAALLDEAREQLGPRLGKGGKVNEEDEIRTYGHIVIDEVQDLSPMQLRMAARRSLNGSMTVVGDLAQATGQFAPRDWDDLLADLPSRRPARLTELTVGYRIPESVMGLATRVLRVAAPALTPPISVRHGDAAPVFERADPGDLGVTVAAAVTDLLALVGDGNVAVITPSSLADPIAAVLADEGVAVGMGPTDGLDAKVTLLPVGMVKGLELDGVVVVEPGRIVAEEPQGLRALYVALTRATQRLTIVHAEPLPEALA